ncbi:MAG: hypothetical protein DYG98_18965 [Haliscomenobacteraceae bacterium CHB4]|nr:hypothetical protein [Haliscomenobacteraceae bacterium CHB4]
MFPDDDGFWQKNQTIFPGTFLLVSNLLIYNRLKFLFFCKKSPKTFGNSFFKRVFYRIFAHFFEA